MRRLGHDVETAVDDLKIVLYQEGDHEMLKAHRALEKAGIIHPSLTVGINDLASYANTRIDAILDNLREELDRRANDSRENMHMGTRLEGWQQAIAFLEELEEKWSAARERP